ncbi:MULTISPECIES: cupin domain-containing protein [unclassified Streptomyces]|uniref:cupin domain-containing protein n=1 Tax=unclassified Streptomyces TaxID=2593676 RepID=UPI000AD1EFD1|nr:MULTISPECIES: cupin domain-containing protein [unclassified Streptomyces]
MTSLSGTITSPVLTDPDTQQAVRFLGGLVRMRARAADTAGAYALLEHTGERGYMSPLHLHESDEETFLILDGTLRVEVGDEVRSVGAGGLALLPRGLAHGFVVTSPTARFLTLQVSTRSWRTWVCRSTEPYRRRPDRVPTRRS